MDLTNDDVQDILRLLDSLPFTEMQLETARFRLTLRRSHDGGWTREADVLAAPNVLPGSAAGPESAREVTGPVPAAPAPAQVPPGPGQGDGARGAAAGADEGLVGVRAPLLGTFYRAPRPGAPPYVEVGSAVDEHTVVGIIETMKLMNSVPAGVSGTVAEIIVGNAQFAEQGTILMRIRADR